jgi:capsid protein
MGIFNIVKKEKQQPKRKQTRAFVGARYTANNNFNTTFNKINAELRTDYIALTLRARALAKNNETVNSYINLMMRSVLGANGFTLNCTAYN